MLAHSKDQNGWHELPSDFSHLQFAFDFNLCLKKTVVWPDHSFIFMEGSSILSFSQQKGLLCPQHNFLKYIKRFKFGYKKLPLDDTLLKHLPFHKPFCSLPFHMSFSTSPDKIAQSKFQLKCLMVFTLSSNC